MKLLSTFLWWPHNIRMIYFHRKNCSDCMKAGKNLRPVTPKKHYNHLPEIKFVEEQIDLDFAGPLDFVRGHCNYILLFLGRFSKFTSAKITLSTSAKKVIDFFTDYNHLLGIPGSTTLHVLTGTGLKSFCDSHNINIIFCRIAAHRISGKTRPHY